MRIEGIIRNTYSNGGLERNSSRGKKNNKQDISQVHNITRK